MTLRVVPCPLCGWPVRILTTARAETFALALTTPCYCAFGDRTRIRRGDNEDKARRAALRAVATKLGQSSK